MRSRTRARSRSNGVCCCGSIADRPAIRLRPDEMLSGENEKGLCGGVVTIARNSAEVGAAALHPNGCTTAVVKLMTITMNREKDRKEGEGKNFVRQRGRMLKRKRAV